MTYFIYFDGVAEDNILWLHGVDETHAARLAQLGKDKRIIVMGIEE